MIVMVCPPPAVAASSVSSARAPLDPRATSTPRPTRRHAVLVRWGAAGWPVVASARLGEGGSVGAGGTRATLARALAVAFHAPIPPARFGVFRM